MGLNVIQVKQDARKTRQIFNKNQKLVKRIKWAEKGVIPDVKSLLTGNKSRNKHVF